MILYKTIAKEASTEQVIEKSRFITYIKPVESKNEADLFIAEIRKKHRDATHNVPAMVLGEHMEIQWCSDDGEPQGTSGAPIVQMLVNEGITNVCVVVTRYFGGIKLGTGGLVRAYTSSAKLGIEKAGTAKVEELLIISYLIDYTALAKVQKAESDETYHIEEIYYTDVVEVKVSVSPEREEISDMTISNCTNGRGKKHKKELAKVKKI